MSAALQVVPRHQSEYQGTFRFFRTVEMDVVRSILTVPKTYRWSSEDGSPPREVFQPQADDRIWYVLTYDGNELIGLFVLVPENSVCLQVHYALLPLAAWLRGRPVAALQALFEWVWRTSRCVRITAKIPAFNRLALQLAENSLMMEYGRNVMSFPKHGRLWDEILLGISRPGAE